MPNQYTGAHLGPCLNTFGDLCFFSNILLAKTDKIEGRLTQPIGADPVKRDNRNYMTKSQQLRRVK
jgi:hypothetical protein